MTYQVRQGSDYIMHIFYYLNPFIPVSAKTATNQVDLQV